MLDDPARLNLSFLLYNDSTSVPFSQWIGLWDDYRAHYVRHRHVANWFFFFFISWMQNFVWKGQHCLLEICPFGEGAVLVDFFNYCMLRHTKTD